MFAFEYNTTASVKGGIKLENNNFKSMGQRTDKNVTEIQEKNDMIKAIECDNGNDLPTSDSNNKDTKKLFQSDIVWRNAIGFGTIHVLAIYGVYLSVYSASVSTFLWAYSLAYLCQLGITVGAHRLFTHRAFQATTALRNFLLVCQTLAGQNCCYVWVRDHRQHHKYSETNADPHNSTRGFFFSHIGWLMMRKHPDVLKYGKNIDMSDLEADPYFMFQKRQYKTLYYLLAVIFPVVVPCYFWGETFLNSFMIAYALRYVVVLNFTWFVNSAAHMFGMRPYDKEIAPAENSFVSFVTGGEGWHNFHHTYPWDYRAAEYGRRFNSNEVFIEFCEKLGLASNLRSVSKSVVKKKVLFSGDGSHEIWSSDYKESSDQVDTHPDKTEKTTDWEFSVGSNCTSTVQRQ